jgi:micrococcal nuclease
MLYCHHCGRKIKKENPFCPYCGKRLGVLKKDTPENTQFKETPKKELVIKKESKFNFTIILVLIIIGIFVFAFIKDSNINTNAILNNSNSTCIYDCCLNESEFKSCEEGLECIDNICVDLEYEKNSDKGYVTKIIDGDTVVLESGEKIRLLGINTPEKGQNCYENASKYLTNKILEKEVLLEKDLDEKDLYGRLLRHIILDGENINIELVEKGLATVYIVGENKKYSSELFAAEEKARQNQGCVWEQSSSCRGCIGISFFHLNAKGDDCENPNDEYLVLRNTCKDSCDLNGWTIKDEATHTYTFEKKVLNEMESLTIHSGFGNDNLTDLFWKNNGNSGKCLAIWNNDGDTIYIHDLEGKLVLDYEGF